MLHHQNEPASLPKPHEFELDDFLLDDLFFGEPKNVSCTEVVLLKDDFLFLVFFVLVFFCELLPSKLAKGFVSTRSTL